MSKVLPARANIAVQKSGAISSVNIGLEKLLRGEEHIIPKGHLAAVIDLLQLALSGLESPSRGYLKKLAANTLVSDALNQIYPEFWENNIRRKQIIEKVLTQTEALQGLSKITTKQRKPYVQLHRFYERLDGITKKEWNQEAHRPIDLVENPLLKSPLMVIINKTRYSYMP